MHYNIPVRTFNSAGVQSVACAIGATHLRFIDGGYIMGSDGYADDWVGFYAMPDGDTGEVRVAVTNGDPVWEDENAQEFQELAEMCNVDLGGK